MRNDQWNGQGNCSECRRQPYCKTQCKANKRYAKLHMFEILAKSYLERTGKKNGT